MLDYAKFVRSPSTTDPHDLSLHVGTASVLQRFELWVCGILGHSTNRDWMKSELEASIGLVPNLAPRLS